MNKSSKLNLSKYISHSKLPVTKLNIKNKKLNNYINNAVVLNTDFSYKTTNLRQQWDNNIYSYNINKQANASQQDKIISNLITNYFKLYNKQLERKANIKYIVPKYKNRMIYNIFVDVSNIKHTNDNVTITLFTYNRSNKSILNKLNALDFTYNARFTNNKLNNKNWNLSYYNTNKNISVKPLYNEMLFNNINKLQYNSKIKFKNNIVQDLHETLNKKVYVQYKHRTKKKINNIINMQKVKHMFNMLCTDKISNLGLCKFILNNKRIDIKPKYLKLNNNNKINKIKKINKICLFTKIYNSNNNQEKHIVCERLITIPKYILTKLNNNNITRNIKKNKKKITIYKLQRLSYLKKKDFLNTIDNRSLKNLKLKKKTNPNKDFYTYKLKKIYRNKLWNINIKYKNIRSDSFLENCISKFEFIKSEFNLVKHIKHCFRLITVNTQLIDENNKSTNNIPSRSLKNIYNIYKLYTTTNKKNFIINQLQKKLVIYYKQMLIINKLKFESIYLTRLKLLLSKIYNKDIKFNIINLKHPNLNSNIYSQVICFKARSRKFAIRTIFNWALNSLRLKRTVKFLYENRNIEEFNKFKNISLDNKKLNKDLLTSNINQILYINSDNNNNIENFVFSNLKNKFLKGVKLQAKGRLTKRLTASRSIFKYGQKGSIRNYQSSYTGLYGHLLRGHVDSNVQYTKLESKNRNGAFGLKGWFSSM